jgi:D-proline reductase (dithiol) PrdB
MPTFDFYPPEQAAAFAREAAEYAFPQEEPTPWTPFQRPLRAARIALVSTAGLRLRNQAAFPADGAGFRLLPAGTPPRDLAFDYTAYDPSEAEEDLNVLVPVDRLRESAARGAVGAPAESFVSIVGSRRDPIRLRQDVDAVAEEFRDDGIDLVLVIPAGFACNQTAALLSRHLERSGLPTVCLATVREIVDQVRPPRAAFLRFPFGRPLGRAGEAHLQGAILNDLLRVARTADRPGRIAELPYRWQGPVDALAPDAYHARP